MQPPKLTQRGRGFGHVQEPPPQPNAPRPSIRPHIFKMLGRTQAPGPAPNGKETADFLLRPPTCSIMLAKAPVFGQGTASKVCSLAGGENGQSLT